MSINSDEIFGSLLLDGLTLLPVGSIIVREVDNWRSHSRFERVEADIRDLRTRMEKGSLCASEGLLDSLTVFRNEQFITPQAFYESAGCISILRALNTTSKFGQAADPILEYTEGVKLLKTTTEADDCLRLFKLISYELESSQLIYKAGDANSPLGFHAIYPRDFFFSSTDKLFQRWDPLEDMIAIVRLLCSRQELQINTGLLDEEMGFGPRRLNPSLAALYKYNLIHHDHELGGIKYVLHWIRLNENAELFWEKQLKNNPQASC